MAAGITIKHKRKAGAFINGDLAQGEWGLDTTNDVWYYSADGTTVNDMSASGVTNSAGANVITKSNGTNLVASRITDDGTDIIATSQQIELGISTGGASRIRVLLDNTVGKVALGDVDYWANGTALVLDDDNGRSSMGDINDMVNGLSFIIDDADEFIALGDVKQYQHLGYTSPAKRGMQFTIDNATDVIQYGQLTAKFGGGIVSLDSFNKEFTVSFIESPPTSAITSANGAAGTNNLTAGAYYWKVTFVTPGGETTGPNISTILTVNPATELPPELSNIAIGSANVIARKIYRTEAGGSVFKYVTTINDNVTTTHTDNLADASLGATIPSANTAIDVRFNVNPYTSFLNGMATQAEAIAYSIALG